MAPLLVNGRVIEVTGPFVVVYDGEQKIREFKSKEEAERFVEQLKAPSAKPKLYTVLDDQVTSLDVD